MKRRFAWLNSVHELDAAQWQTLWRSDYPFVQQAFLAALEDSGCTTQETGWQPRHLAVFESSVDDKGGESETCIALMLGFIKTHSYGEYVFDWGWADAYHRSGRQYYPKWISAIPFTPARGPRLANLKHIDRDELISQMREQLNVYAQQQNLSGWHCLFPESELYEKLQGDAQHNSGSLVRTGCQFHWHNAGSQQANYSNFDDFLASFNSRKRKSLKKERQQVKNSGVELERLVGEEIKETDWDNFYRFYHTTYLKRSGNTGYLNREFFQALAQDCAEQVLLVKAEKNGNMIAGALYFFDKETLYGRYWGCDQEIPGLHFEACYYQGIEFAIERDLSRFDPGAQGEHKIQRGFEPTLTYSNHWLAEPMFFDAVEDFLHRETEGVMAYQKECAELLPFKKAE